MTTSRTPTSDDYVGQEELIRECPLQSHLADWIRSYNARFAIALVCKGHDSVETFTTLDHWHSGLEPDRTLHVDAAFSSGQLREKERFIPHTIKSLRFKN